MKRITLICCAVLISTTLFAVSKPSLDGRAVVADEGILPRGLFAKTVGYLPGDSVSVTNPATGVTINVLVLGSLDPSSGVAILLSPEAADKLFITPNANVQVQITKRTGLLDQAASGSAVLAADPDKNPEASIPQEIKDELDAKQASAEKALAEATTEPVPVEPAEENTAVTAKEPSEETTEIESSPEEKIPQTEAIAAAATESTAGTTEAPSNSETVLVPENQGNAVVTTTPEPAEIETIPEQPVTTVAAVPENPASSTIPVPEAETTIASAEKKTAAQTSDNKMIGNANTPESMEKYSAGSVIPTVADNKPQPEAPLQEAVTAEAPVPETKEPVVSKNHNPTTTDAVQTMSTSPEASDIPSSKELQPVPELKESTAVASIIPAPQEKESSGNDSLSLDEDLLDPFAPIILIPAEENPPKTADILLSPEPLVSQTEPAIPVSPAETAEPVTAMAAMSDRTVIPSLSQLKSGAYYVQIATYAEEANIKSVLDTYGDTYPVILVPMTSGKAYQIMIGPLSVDEYGTILARFKSFGYKDAFLRKIR